MSTKRRGNYTEIGNRAWSYSTALRDVLPDGRTIGNVTRYSVTTSKHQSFARVRSCRVQVDGVPIGTDNLAAWFAEECDRWAHTSSDSIPQPPAWYANRHR